ncbi:MAG: hypothetical protein RLZZ324_1183 [Candidatus Parcubacteria bacterium]|jgi:hypothetical protein
MEALIKEKLKRIAADLEATKGELKFFACVRPTINEQKWDIVVSAEWVTADSLKADLGVIFDAFKKEFNGEYALRFNGIFPLVTSAPFVKSVTQLFSMTSGDMELKSVQLGDFAIEEMILIISRPESSIL